MGRFVRAIEKIGLPALDALKACPEPPGGVTIERSARPNLIWSGSRDKCFRAAHRAGLCIKPVIALAINQDAPGS